MSDLKLGTWLVICDRCGFKRHAPDEVIKTWDNLIVCAPSIKPGCYEERHPQDLIRPIAEQQDVPYTRPEPTETYVSVAYVSTGVGIQVTTIPTGTFTNTL